MSKTIVEHDGLIASSHETGASCAICDDQTAPKRTFRRRYRAAVGNVAGILKRTRRSGNALIQKTEEPVPSLLSQPEGAFPDITDVE